MKKYKHSTKRSNTAKFLYISLSLIIAACIIYATNAFILLHNNNSNINLISSKVNCSYSKADTNNYLISINNNFKPSLQNNFNIKNISFVTLQTIYNNFKPLNFGDKTLNEDTSEQSNYESSSQIEQGPDLDSMAIQILNIVNNARAQNGLHPLKQNQALVTVAKSRSSDMTNRNYFSHTTPEGKNIYSILIEYGIKYAAAGENIQYASPPSWGTPESFFNIWMSSSSHRDNILSSNFSQIGIGISEGNNNRVEVLVFIN